MGHHTVLVWIVASAALSLVGCTGAGSGGSPIAPSGVSVASAPGSNLASILENAPFRGRDTGTAEFLQTGCAAGLLPLTTSTVGTATLIGNYTFETEECFDLNALTFTGSFTITAASGDTITGPYSGHVTGFLDEVSPTYLFTGVVTGGSGRFAGATGEMAGTGQANLATHTESRSFSGTLSAVPRGRS